MNGSVYRIRVKGHLPAGWAEDLGGLDLCCDADGCTSLTGVLPDQAALYGLLARLRDLGLTLISLAALPAEQESRP